MQEVDEDAQEARSESEMPGIDAKMRTHARIIS